MARRPEVVRGQLNTKRRRSRNGIEACSERRSPGGRSQPSTRSRFWLNVLFGFAVALLVAAALFPKAAPEGLAVSLACGLTGAVTLLVTIAYLAL